VGKAACFLFPSVINLDPIIHTSSSTRGPFYNRLLISMCRKPRHWGYIMFTKIRTCSLIASFSLVLFPTLSQASFFQTLLPIPAGNAVPSKVQAPAKCTDFSGNWKGTCSTTRADGSKWSGPLSFQLAQNECYGITIGNEYIDIGGILTETHPDFTSSTALSWNTDQTVLNIVQAGISSTSNSDPAGHATTTYYPLAQSGTMKMDQANLVLTSSGTGAQMSCTLNKQ